ncbi:MAG: DUF952 domain-containing protein [Paracoccaceae bacterium]
MLIYKIFRSDEYAAFLAAGISNGAPIDLADGYIHISTGAQVAETAAKYFAGVEGLMLLALEANNLGDALKWEPSRGGALFPHLFRPLEAKDVLWAKPLPSKGAGHDFPQGVLS